MTWSVRAVFATIPWVAAGLLTLVFILSGMWIYLPFAFASGGGEKVLILLLIIAALATAAHLVGRGATGGGQAG
jgi:hypothetical protein